MAYRDGFGRRRWPGLSIEQQADFSQGVYRNPAPELIPRSGMADAVNACLEEDGAVFRRGGSVFKSTSDFAANLTFLWDGWLAGGPRTVFSSSAAFGVLAADDFTPNSIGFSGTDGQRPATGNGLVYIPCGASAASGTVTLYGGSRLTAVYSTGTVTTTALSKTVTGVGTTWTGNVDAGCILLSGTSFLGVVQSVDSNTQITLRDFAATVVAGAAYTSNPVYQFTPVGANTVYVGTAADPARLLVGYQNKVAFSAAGNPLSFAATDFHQMPDGQLIGLAGIQDTAFVFTTAGVYTIENMSFNLVDAVGNVQERLQQLTKDVILWDARGIAGYRNQLVVPGVDDVYLVGPTQFPSPISDPIRTLYRTYVQSGYSCGGGSVYRNHYILPILNGTTWVDTLVFRLDAGGWTRWAGHGGASAWFAARSQATTRRPLLLSANARRVVDMTAAWSPTAATKNDADGTTHVFSMTTRDYASGTASNHNLVKKVRVRYELNDAASDHPVLNAYFGSGQVQTSGPFWGASTWGSFTWADASNVGFALLAGTAPVDTGVNPYPWTITGQAPIFYRFKLTCTNPCSKLVVREIDSFIRPRGRQ